MKDLGYEKPTPVQEQAIPLVLAGRDLMAGAQTGTGKTAAFALPILQRLSPQASTSASPARHPVRALVLTPTRELAVQVAESFKDYGKHLPLRSTVVYGGVDMDAQIDQLRRGVEILIKVLGLTEREALETYADYLIGANRYRHGRDVLLPAGHLPPCEELRELWTGYGQTAPACETVSAAPPTK